jgi:hypothetical protein
MPKAKTICAKCGYEMLARTAERTGGLCVPCSEGRKVDRTPRDCEQKLGRSLDWMCIGILLDNDKSEYADYFFEADVWDKDPRFKSRSMRVGTNRGLMRLHKDSGEIELLQAMPEDHDEKRFRSAAAKLKKHWEAGEIPKATQFACG